MCANEQPTLHILLPTIVADLAVFICSHLPLSCHNSLYSVHKCVSQSSDGQAFQDFLKVCHINKQCVVKWAIVGHMENHISEEKQFFSVHKYADS